MARIRHYRYMLVQDLIEVLRSRGLEISGNKTILVARLNAYDESQ